MKYHWNVKIFNYPNKSNSLDYLWQILNCGSGFILTSRIVITSSSSYSVKCEYKCKYKLILILIEQI